MVNGVRCIFLRAWIPQLHKAEIARILVTSIKLSNTWDNTNKKTQKGEEPQNQRRKKS
jgi:hypothetical protein